jgi:hypothetical protein
MTSATHRPFELFVLFALLLWAAAAPGCVSKANPVLPSTGPGGRGASGTIDGGTTDDGLATNDVDGPTTSDAQEVSADSAAPNGPCDLLTYIRTLKGCPTTQACYPVSGSGKCQTPGFQGAFNPCVPNDSTGTLTCAAGLACTPTPDMGSVCLFLCDFRQPACDLGNACVQIGTTDVGICQLLPG